MARRHAQRHDLPVSQIVIPARLASTRLPQKLLLRETGRTLIQHTYEAARRARRPRGVIVATDHESILEAVLAFGGQACLTGADLASGTDRVAEVARRMPEVEIFVNVQGDEPLVAAEAVRGARHHASPGPAMPASSET